MSLLTMRNIKKSFFGRPVLEKVDLDVEAGEIHALLGENGAGKTTLMNILYGIYSRDEGEILWQDKKVDIHSPKDAIALRIGMVHQHFMLVPTLTVSQNITLGLKSKGHPIPRRQDIDREITEISNRYGLKIDPKALVSSLSVGEQQRVEIMKLLYRDAKLLILDEPTAVLTPQETDLFFDVLRTMRQHGHSVIVITHKIPEVMDITDRITVLRDGHCIATVNTADTGENQLSQYMIGRQLNPASREELPACSLSGMILREVTLHEQGRNRLEDITLEIRAGEIVGIAGVDGNGQQELAEVITGVRKHSSGTITLADMPLDGLSVRDRKRMGIGYIPGDRHHDGLLMDMDLPGNMLLKNHMEASCVSHGLINEKKVRQDTLCAVEEYAVKTPGLRVPIRFLSGGNQQKLILARELAGDPRAVVAFQPTRGLDISASEFIRHKLLEHRRKNCSILLISTDLEEILALSDRIAVLYEGKIMGILPNDGQVNVEAIGLMMAGRKGQSA